MLWHLVAYVRSGNEALQLSKQHVMNAGYAEDPSLVDQPDVPPAVMAPPGLSCNISGCTPGLPSFPAGVHAIQDTHSAGIRLSFTHTAVLHQHCKLCQHRAACVLLASHQLLAQVAVCSETTSAASSCVSRQV
jgi:hypothetical protein